MDIERTKHVVPDLRVVSFGTVVLVEQMTRFAAMDESEWQRLSEGARRRVEGYTWNDAGEKFALWLEAAQRAPVFR